MKFLGTRGPSNRQGLLETQSRLAGTPPALAPALAAAANDDASSSSHMLSSLALTLPHLNTIYIYILGTVLSSRT